MSDMFQPGEIATIHKYNTADVAIMEKHLRHYSDDYPIALVLPALKSDFFSEANRAIIKVLEEVDYIREVVYSIGDFETDDELRDAQDLVKNVTGTTVTFLWTDGPRISALLEMLDEKGLHTGPRGKGKGAWLAYGYVLGKADFDSIVLHDCDVVTYDREFLARLCLPVTIPHFDYEFCKGFYGRFADRLYGRVTRLFVFPLLETLMSALGPVHFLQYMSSFRYPLAGEFAMSTRIAQTVRIPSDWGLEVGTLAEVYRKCSTRRIGQIELCDRYDHKHQDLSPDDKTKGLYKMGIDIARSLFTSLAIFGVDLESKLKVIQTAYLRNAEDMIRKYDADSFTNQLHFDRHKEELAVETFCNALKQASANFLEDPLGVPLIPNWSRVNAAIPDFYEQMLEAVRLDNS